MSREPLSVDEITLLGVCVAAVLLVVVVFGTLAYRICTGGW
jgi:hypothetical protein